MGGDNAPAELVAGAVEAVAEFDVDVRLVGDEDVLREELARYDVDGLPIRIVPSEGYVREGESPAIALRQNPRASVIVATGLVKFGLADACVSMGSTGATMAAAAFVLGMPEGIDRPAIGGPVLGLAPRTAIIDLGANVDSRPAQLLTFGAIGDVFARKFWGIENPRVALLSVGSEAGKGNNQVKETTELLEKSGLNFIGNIEPNELPFGRAEVVVCDGFVGNVVMKLTEGLGLALADHLRGALRDSLPAEELERVVSKSVRAEQHCRDLGRWSAVRSQWGKHRGARPRQARRRQARHRYGQEDRGKPVREWAERRACQDKEHGRELAREPRPPGPIERFAIQEAS